MKNVITSAIFVAITATSAFAGEKARNLIDPVQVKISSLETQVEGLKTVATSLAVQLRAALDNGSNTDEVTYLQEQIIITEESLVLAMTDLGEANDAVEELEDELNTVKNNWWHTKQNVIRLSNLNIELEDDVEELEMIIDGYQGQIASFETQAEAWFYETEQTQADLQMTIDVKQDLIVDLQEELDDVYEDLETAYDDMDDLDEEILDLKAHNQDDQITALTNIIHEMDAVAVDQEATIAAYDAALDDIASIIEGDTDNALEEVLSFISSLDLDI